MPDIHYNDNGDIRLVKAMYYNDNGTIRLIRKAYYNDNGTIRQVFQYDVTPPVINLLGANPYYVQQYLGSYIEPGATADGGEEVIPFRHVSDTELDTQVAGTYYISYRAEDEEGNVSTTRREVIVRDTIAPVITLIGGDITLNEGEAFVDPGATLDDLSYVTTPLIITGSVDVDAVGTYTRYYNATDIAGNQAVQRTRLVYVVDITPPVIALTGATTVVLEFGRDAYNELGAVANDGSAVVITGAVGSAVGTYYRRYNAIDESGNVATERVRTIHVRDTTIPVIALAGANPYSFDHGYALYAEPGASADDGSQVTVSGDSVADINAAIGEYSRRYNAEDAHGNDAVQRVRVVSHIQSVTASGLVEGTWLASGLENNDATIEFIRNEEVVDSITIRLSSAGITALGSHAGTTIETELFNVESGGHVRRYRATITHTISGVVVVQEGTYSDFAPPPR